MAVMLTIAGIIVLLGGAFLLQGLRNIPNDPPHVAVVTRWGERTRKVKGGGWRFFPLYGIWHGAILVDARKRPAELLDLPVSTPELAEVRVSLSILWRPDATDSNGSDASGSLVDFLDTRAEGAVEKALSGILVSQLRLYAISHVADWPSMIATKDQFARAIMASVEGPAFEKRSEADQREAVRALSITNGSLRFRGLGIEIVGLNVTSISASGRLHAAAESFAVETQLQRGEDLDFAQVKRQIAELQALGMAQDEAVEFVQVMRHGGKQSQTHRLELSSKTAAAVAKLPEAVLAAIMGTQRPRP